MRFQKIYIKHIPSYGLDNHTSIINYGMGHKKNIWIPRILDKDVIEVRWQDHSTTKHKVHLINDLLFIKLKYNGRLVYVHIDGLIARRIKSGVKPTKYVPQAEI